jgi:hypothetical protein
LEGDDITRDRPGAKYLWLMFVRQHTKWSSCIIRKLDDSSSPVVNALKSIPKSITFFLFKKKKQQTKHTFLLLSTEHSSPYWMKFYSFPRNRAYDGGFEDMAQDLFPYCIRGLVI